MSPEAAEPSLEQTLRDLPRVGTLVKDHGYRQVWRVGYGAKPFYLKFYPREGSRWKRLVRGNPAMREFVRLQWLQKAAVPAPRAVAVLMGFKLTHAGRDLVGDVVLLEAIEPAERLDEYLNRLELAAEPVPDRLGLAKKIVELVQTLGRAKLGHSDLNLGNFLLRDGKLYLLDAYAVRRGGLRREDVLQLGHSVRRYATTADLQRGWEALGGEGWAPPANPVSRRQWRKFLERVTGDNRWFGRLQIALPAGGAAGGSPAPVAGVWRGHYFKQFKYPHRWSPASRLTVGEKDWAREFPALMERLGADALRVIKRSRSGDVLEGEVVLGGKPVEVIVKRPRRRYWYRYLNEIGRGARARRAWKKAWNLIVRNVPTAWPLMFMEKRVLGYVTDTVIVFEKAPGPTLAAADLGALEPTGRDMLFRRLGRVLRKIERLGFSHFDAKASNWIVQPDEKRGPVPVLIDVDGIRRRQWVALGIQRLLRSMKDHPQYSADDSLALCQGYAPAARLQREGEALDAPEEEEDLDGFSEHPSDAAHVTDHVTDVASGDEANGAP